ncbi:unnamed protein product [Macrosiphum euphorbiae]|uniref:Uncharacterized protein n=1 Tax=Macrosiphum euphorbiae TaxID=13131 RepID=A0AAV0WQ11_9HEMI|nr:unnamed protein product [Macrosiphum euphorbiae]
MVLRRRPTSVGRYSRSRYVENPKAITLRSELRQKTFNRSQTGRGDHCRHHRSEVLRLIVVTMDKTTISRDIQRQIEFEIIVTVGLASDSALRRVQDKTYPLSQSRSDTIPKCFVVVAMLA